MEFNNLKFVCTCYACPEQYDVFKNGKQVGYVRLRWGGLVCEYPDVFGEVIYSTEIGDGWTGEFRNEKERKKYLQIIANKIEERLQKDENLVR